MSHPFSLSQGFPLPFGVSPSEEGFNFSLFSAHATQVSLCLFNLEESAPIEIPLDPVRNKTGDVWHIHVSKLPAHYQYGYRLEGPYDPLKGLCYDSRRILLDPYAKLVASPNTWGKIPDPALQTHLKGVVYPHEPFDWGNDKHPDIDLKDLIIYEMHVRGFTQDSSSKVKHPGTFLGMIEKIPYLKSLGINAVELMPIHEFPETEVRTTHCQTNETLYQYWGYSSLNFFSPMNRFGTGERSTITEFKMLVKALHEAGIEVILDVVFNHTAEGNLIGKILSFKGIENNVYYMTGPGGEYYNFSGCGNTVNCNTPVVRELIRDSLRYYVTEMHVDGFRFDLASVLVRDHDGIALARPPLIEAITKDPILAKTKLIAEPWDAGGLYQVGRFPGQTWAEWNGEFRDSVRRFIKGTDGEIGRFATRLCGSQDLYGKGKSPCHSINYVTSHDGFTLADLVAYSQKHNESNGEHNQDGMSVNESWNCGIEGETSDPTILKLRAQQMRNHLVALLVSQGVPMLFMGDEYAHTKQGNNNSWCHDSRLNWFQWDTLEENSDLLRFYKNMIAFRKAHPALSHARFLKEKDVVWHGVLPNRPEWTNTSRLLAFSLQDIAHHYAIYVAFNAFFKEVSIQMPAVEKGGGWKVIVDTSKTPPEDFTDEASAQTLTSLEYTLPAYSALLLKRPLLVT